MRYVPGVRSASRAVAWTVAGIATCAAVLAVTSREAPAQIGNSDFWLYQPQESEPVGRAWCNADRTVEYWAFVDGEYRFADATNIPANPWHLEARKVAGGPYANYAEFKAAVLAAPQMSGKTIILQNHAVTEETVEN